MSISASPPSLPLAGLRVVEFSHMVMGPTCGMVLGDLGAEVIKIEPIKGDSTRTLLGSGAGFFPLYNRNKKSIAIDLNRFEGREIAYKLLASADVVCENFKPQTLQKQGLDYPTLKAKLANGERLIYVSHKGFLPGPYAHRTALDEVVQMMGGLAYMTGREGDPLRAGSSVNDMMGGIFGALGAMAALMQRGITGRGQQVESALFENNILLVAQHMLQYLVTGHAAQPMPSRISPWGIYDVFTVAQGEQIFLAVVSDGQWTTFCERLGFSDLAQDERIQSNNARVEARSWLLPELRQRLSDYSASELAAEFEAAGLPYAPISKPHELLDDSHLQATGTLAPMRLPDGREAQTVLLPLMMDGQRLPKRLDPPRLGEHGEQILRELGYAQSDIENLIAQGVLGRAPSLPSVPQSSIM